MSFLYYPASVQIILGCELFCCWCYIPLLRHIVPGRLSQLLEYPFIHLVLIGYCIPPNYSFNPPNPPLFSRAFHFNFQLTMGDYFFHFPGKSWGHMCFLNTYPFTQNLSMELIPALLLFLPPNLSLLRPWFSSCGTQPSLSVPSKIARVLYHQNTLHKFLFLLYPLSIQPLWRVVHANWFDLPWARLSPL